MYDSMVTKVADAIFQKYPSFLRINCDGIALIAIAALRNPTEGMRKAGDEVLPEHKGFEDDATAAFKAMINQALMDG